MKKVSENWNENQFNYKVELTSYELMLIKFAIITKLADIEVFGTASKNKQKEYEKMLEDINQIPF